MSGLEDRLLEVVSDDEEPLYTAYRELVTQSGHEVPLEEFLDMIRRLVDQDRVRLWSAGPSSHDRTELYELPNRLIEAYREVGNPTRKFDPLGLSLSRGPAAPPLPPAEWLADLDYIRGEFTIRALPEAADRAITQLKERHPELRLSVHKRDLVGDRVVISGAFSGASQE